MTWIHECCSTISFLYPAQNSGLVKGLQDAKVTSFGEPAAATCLNCCVATKSVPDIFCSVCNSDQSMPRCCIGACRAGLHPAHAQPGADV